MRATITITYDDGETLEYEVDQVEVEVKIYPIDQYKLIEIQGRQEIEPDYEPP